MTELVSYCSECDAPPGQCDHTAPRYLDPIDYPVTLKDGSRAYAIPAHERQRWDSGSGYTTEGAAPTIAPPKPDTLAQILSRLEPHVYLSDHIRTLIADAHNTNPLQATQLSHDIVRRIDHLDNPSGALVKGARQIVSYD